MRHAESVGERFRPVLSSRTTISSVSQGYLILSSVRAVFVMVFCSLWEAMSIESFGWATIGATGATKVEPASSALKGSDHPATALGVPLPYSIDRIGILLRASSDTSVFRVTATPIPSHRQFSTSDFSVIRRGDGCPPRNSCDSVKACRAIAYRSHPMSRRCRAGIGLHHGP